VLAISRPAASRPARQPTKGGTSGKAEKAEKAEQAEKARKADKGRRSGGEETMLLLMPVPSSTELPGPEVSAVAEGLGEAAWRAILALIDGVREALFNRPGWCGALRPGEKYDPDFLTCAQAATAWGYGPARGTHKVSPAISYPRR
jgi:hypothetical protein